MNLKPRIIKHYDTISPHCLNLWGVHIHHGYWQTGQETKEKAQEQLIEKLISRAGIKKGAHVLDVGCGIGGTAILLHKTLQAKVTAITISPVQVAIGRKLSQEAGAPVEFLAMDAEKMSFRKQFDIVWSIEAISHFSNKRKFFKKCQEVLKPGGKIVLTDWLKADDLKVADQRKYIEPIENAMLLPRMEAPNDYLRYLAQAGFRSAYFEDMSVKVSKTWEISTALIKRPSLWKFAAEQGKDFIRFLRGFQAMRKGYQSGSLVYGLIVAQKAP
ncbi:MAG: class I SAM-dependent methyltransferase [Acidobacteria bacterium]|nr:class I SAM-dependent methyltransferase [Acidobacteriota bacterium]